MPIDARNLMLKCGPNDVVYYRTLNAMLKIKLSEANQEYADEVFWELAPEIYYIGGRYPREWVYARAH